MSQDADKLLAEMWQAYANEQCGWADSTVFHSHNACDRAGSDAAGEIFSLALLQGMPESVKRPELPEHFESKDVIA